MKLRVYKIRPAAKLPLRAHHADAGMDLFYCPNGERSDIVTHDGLAISPRESKLIPSGLKIEVPYGHMLEIKNKSGIAHKRRLITGACVVDSGYDGEIYVNLHNIGLTTEYIMPGDKIAQACRVAPPRLLSSLVVFNIAWQLPFSSVTAKYGWFCTNTQEFIHG